jgi:hypothetical protein
MYIQKYPDCFLYILTYSTLVIHGHLPVSLDAVITSAVVEIASLYNLRIDQTLKLFYLQRGVGHGKIPEFWGRGVKAVIRTIDGNEECTQTAEFESLTLAFAWRFKPRSYWAKHLICRLFMTLSVSRPCSVGLYND